MLTLASLAYAISIFIDLSSYFTKYYVQDKQNIRYLLSLINIYQYSARAFVLIFTPIAAYYTETVKDIDLVWLMILLCHIFTVLLILPLFSVKFGQIFSRLTINLLNFFFGRSKELHVNILKPNSNDKVSTKTKVTIFMMSLIAGFFFSISITFLYYVSFYYPQKALTLSSYTQIINLVGVMLYILFLDPKIMSSIDKHSGISEIVCLATGRMVAHCVLIIILFIIH